MVVDTETRTRWFREQQTGEYWPRFYAWARTAGIQLSENPLAELDKFWAGDQWTVGQIVAFRANTKEGSVR